MHRRQHKHTQTTHTYTPTRRHIHTHARTHTYTESLTNLNRHLFISSNKSLLINTYFCKNSDCIFCRSTVFGVCDFFLKPLRPHTHTHTHTTPPPPHHQPRLLLLLFFFFFDYSIRSIRFKSVAVPGLCEGKTDTEVGFHADKVSATFDCSEFTPVVTVAHSLLPPVISSSSSVLLYCL